MTNYGSNDLIERALRAGAEAMLAVLNGTEHTSIKDSVAPGSQDQPVEYDPLTDEPPLKPVPKGGTEAQGWMSSVAYLGAIGRLNHEEGRGATSEEVTEFAKRAGYRDGREVNGWNSRPASNSIRSIENRDGARFLNEPGLDYLRRCAKKLGIELVGEMSAVPPLT